MSEDPRHAMAAALDSDDPLAPLHALRWAIGWAATRMAELRRAADDATPLAAVIALDDALDQVAGLGAQLPGLLAAAEAGRPGEEHIQERHNELEQLARTVADHRRDCDRLAAVERQLHERAAEHAELHGRLTELRHLERLVTVLDELRGQAAVVDARLAALRDRVGDTETGLTRASGELVQLSDDQLAALAGPARRALREATAAQARLAEREQQLGQDRAALAAAVEADRRLRAEREETVAALQAYAAADEQVLAALLAVDRPAGRDHGSALDRTREITAGVQARLQEVDDVLRRVLEADRVHREQQHAVRGWAGAGSAAGSAPPS